MRWGVVGVLLVIVACCVGCEPPPSNAPIAAAVAPGQAKLSITRESEESLGFAPVHIALDGTQLIDLAKGQTYTGGIPAGSVSLTASMDGQWGKYTERFTTVPGRTYTFLVERRVEHAVATSLNNYGVIGGIAAMALDSGEQSGPYKITPVSPTQ
jgi:hypothetical protein